MSATCLRTVVSCGSREHRRESLWGTRHHWRESRVSVMMGGGSSGRRDTARWPSRSCGRAGSVERPQVRVVSSVVPEPWRLGDRVTLAPFPGRLRTRGGAEVPGPLSGFRLSALRARDGLPSSRFIVSLHAASHLPLKSPALRSAGLNPNSFQIK